MTCAVTVTVPAGVSADKAINAVSFVRSDGRDVFSFFVRREAVGPSATNPDGLVGSKLQAADLVPRVAPGTYYVFPDMWTDGEAHTAFIRRLRAGETPPADVARFVVAAGQSVSGTINTSTAQQAIVNWIRPTVEADGQSGIAPER
jgi:hypothetical protein